MTERKELGRIQSIELGYGGYNDAMLGVSVSLGGESWGTADFRGTWASRPSYAEWTLDDQRKRWADVVEWVRDLLRDAKKQKLSQLVNAPVEATFDSGHLSSWRILKEVL